MGFVEYQGPLLARLRGARNSQTREGYKRTIKQTCSSKKRNRCDYRDRVCLWEVTRDYNSRLGSHEQYNRHYHHSYKNRY